MVISSQLYSMNSYHATHSTEKLPVAISRVIAPELSIFGWSQSKAPSGSAKLVSTIFSDYCMIADSFQIASFTTPHNPC